MSRRVRLLISTAAAGLIMSGCATGSGEPGAAAVIGDTEIPLSQVDSWYDSVLEQQPQAKPRLQKQGQMDELGRQLASLSVQQELVERTARREGVMVTEQQVTDRINQQGGQAKAVSGQLTTPEMLRATVRTELLAIELGREYVDRTAVTFDLAQATTREQAETKARRMAKGETDAVLDSDPNGRRDLRLRSADSPQDAAVTPLFAASPGTVVAFEAPPQSSKWLVARINDRSTTATGGPNNAGKASEQVLYLFGMRLSGMLGERTGIELNPRYGVWDQVGMSAAPNENETLGFWFGGPDDLKS